MRPGGSAGGVQGLLGERGSDAGGEGVGGVLFGDVEDPRVGRDAALPTIAWGTLPGQWPGGVNWRGHRDTGSLRAVSGRPLPESGGS